MSSAERAMKAIADAVTGVGLDLAAGAPRPSCGGKSILDLIWDQLMEVYQDLMEWRPVAVDPDHPDWMHQEDAEDRGKLKGQALGFATAIAIITNPYAPDLDAVRAEAGRRYTTKESGDPA